MQIELKRLQHETGITFIFVTHDQEEALTMSDRVAVMSQGKILQIGSPREIYDHPAERFVADFIGDTNFLAALVVSAEGRRAVLRLSSGREVGADLPEGMAPGMVAGGKVTAAIRPEHATLMTGNGDLQGVLENIVYFGTDTHYHVRLTDSTAFVVRNQNLRDSTETFQTGQPVEIVLKPDAVQVLRD
jgi:spermidine/putrescine transport system ATP-binding protein